MEEEDLFNEVYPEDEEDDELDGYELADTDAVYSVERMAELLVLGEDIDRDFILSETRQLLGHCADDFQRILLPVMCENCAMWTDEIQFKCAQALSYIVACPITPDSARIIMVTSITMLRMDTHLLDDDRIFYYQVWSGILVEAMQTKELTVAEEKKSTLLVLSDSFAESPMMEDRKASARIYGALASVYDPTTVQKRILPHILRLFDDPNIIVLGTAMESVTKVASTLPVEFIDNSIWPRLIKLTDSEDVRIRCTALRSLSSILEHLRTENANELRERFRGSIVKLMKREVRIIKVEAKEDLRHVSDEKYMVLEVQAETFGEFLYLSVEELDGSFLKEVYESYAIMASCNGPLLRRNVSYNFPGFVLCMRGRFGDLISILTLLSKDKDDEVRWNLSVGLHETLQILLEDPNSDFDSLGSAVLLLLKDDNPAVTTSIMERFHEIVTMFQKADQPEQVQKLVNGLTHLKGMVDGSWRLQEMICEKLQLCMNLFPEKTIVDVILPLLWKLVQQGMPPVRTIAVRTIVHCLRYVSDKTMLKESVRHFYVELGSLGNPYRIRLSLVDAAIEAIEVFSSMFFREFFAKPVFQLVEDPVSNVRVKLASQAQYLTPVCMNMSQFKAMMTRLRKDRDRDVVQILREYPQKVKVENGKFTSKELLLKDQEKLEAEVIFYSKVVESRKSLSREGSNDAKPLATGERSRAVSRLRRSSLVQGRRTSSFTAGQGGADTDNEEEEEADLGGSFIRRMRRSSSRRRSSSADGATKAKETMLPTEQLEGLSLTDSENVKDTNEPSKAEPSSSPSQKKGGLHRLLRRK